MADEEDVSVCAECGASIYPEHLSTGIAGYHDGKLLCTHCLKDAKSHEAATDAEAAAPIKFEEGEREPEREGKPKHVIRSLQVSALGGAEVYDDSKYARPMAKGVPFATRCRVFHCKLTDVSIGTLNEQINGWADSHPDIEIKFATCTAGKFEGKDAGNNLIITVFY